MMYVPKGFEMQPDDLQQLLVAHGAGDLVTYGRNGLAASLIPFVYDQSVGPHGRLRGHLARNNPQWQHQPDGEALVIVRGPDAYITPAWYATKAEHGRVVPTWNYVTAHVYGAMKVVDDVAFVRRVVHELTEKHEAGRDEPWAVSDAPPPFIEGQLRAIVGVELLVSRIEAKAKVSQNRSDADIDGVQAGLRRSGEGRMAGEVAMRRPHRG
jgi:transcriptional regulator